MTEWTNVTGEQSDRSHAWTRLEPVKTSIDGYGTVDFVPSVADEGFWRVSDNARFSVRLWALSDVTASGFTGEGRP